MNMCIVVALLVSIAVTLVPLSARARSAPHPTGFRVSLSSDKAEYILGENVVLAFTIENVGTDSFEVEFGGDSRGTSRAVNFSVSAVDSAGSEMPDPQPQQICFGGLVFRSNLASGLKHTEKLSLLRYRRIASPGLYRITVSHSCGWAGEAKDRPIAEAKIQFRLPSEAEAEQRVASMIKKANRPAEPGKPREFVDFTTLHSPIFLRPLFIAAKAGNADAVIGVSNIPTREATTCLLELAEEMEGKSGALAASLLQSRPPPVVFPGGQTPPSSFPAEVWDESLKEQTVRIGIRWMVEKSPSVAAAGAGLLKSVAGASEAGLLMKRLNMAIEEVGEARSARAEIGNYPGSIPDILGVFAAMRTRGWTLSLSDAADNATKVVFLDGYRVKPPPRPDGFEIFALECLASKSAIVRESALWALPRPLPAEVAETVLRMLSDPDGGVQRAARFASHQREHFTPQQIQTEQNRIMEKFKGDPTRMIEEMNRFMARVMDAAVDAGESEKSEPLSNGKAGA